MHVMSATPEGKAHALQGHKLQFKILQLHENVKTGPSFLTPSTHERKKEWDRGEETEKVA